MSVREIEQELKELIREEKLNRLLKRLRLLAGMKEIASIGELSAKARERTFKRLIKLVKRARQNPIIYPRAENGWESWQTFNPGAIMLNNKIHFLYRAIGEDGVSRFGYANSKDGVHINERLSYPVYEHDVDPLAKGEISFSPSGGSFAGAEDPRIVRVENEDILYITYTAFNHIPRVALTSIKVEDFLNKRWRWKKAVYLSPPGEIHKNWVIFPEKINGKYAILHSITPRILIEYLSSLEFDGKTFIKSYHKKVYRKGHWDTWVRGVGTVPLKTPYGWLIFYHATSEGEEHKYKVGAMLLDLKNPERILYRSKYPILEPKQFYEITGFKPGIVYASSAIVKGDTLFLYYGGSDTYVNVAISSFSRFLQYLREDKKPTFKFKKLKKKK